MRQIAPSSLQVPKLHFHSAAELQSKFKLQEQSSTFPQGFLPKVYSIDRHFE